MNVGRVSSRFAAFVRAFEKLASLPDMFPDELPRRHEDAARQQK